MKKLFSLILVFILLAGVPLIESNCFASEVTETKITAESFNGIWVADTVFADNELHTMSEYNLVMMFKIEDGLAKMGEDAQEYGSRVQDFESSFADEKLTLVNENETIILSFNEEGTLVWDENGIIYSFYKYEEEA